MWSIELVLGCFLILSTLTSHDYLPTPSFPQKPDLALPLPCFASALVTLVLSLPHPKARLEQCYFVSVITGARHV